MISEFLHFAQRYESVEMEEAARKSLMIVNFYSFVNQRTCNVFVSDALGYVISFCIVDF